MTSNRGLRRPRPLPRGEELFTPAASPSRQAIENRSATPLLWLHQLPVWVAPAILVALLVTGLATRGPVAAVALAGVALALGWLAAISWPRLDASGRVLRAVTIAIVLAVAVIQASR